MFIAFIDASPDANDLAREAQALAGDVLGISEHRVEQKDGCTVYLGMEPGLRPQLAVNAGGWLVLQGLIFDALAANPVVSPTQLLRTMQDGTFDWNRYEGAFSMLVWDGMKRQALLVSDQLCTQKLYYGTTSRCAYVTTVPLMAAKVLRLGLCPIGSREFLGRGSVMAPNSLFAGMRCADIGTHIRYSARQFSVNRHWACVYEPLQLSFREAVGRIVDVVVDRTRRVGATHQPIVYDITSGYDSRFNVAAAIAAQVRFGLTVNGADDDVDVCIAHKVAEALSMPLDHYDPSVIWRQPIDATLRRNLLYRTSVGLRFTEAYMHHLTRPLLGRRYALHVGGGVGTDVLRYHPWGQEFHRIGSRRPANMENFMRYRMLQSGPPPVGLFQRNFMPALKSDLQARFLSIQSEWPGSVNTQICEAAHIWKNSGHFSSYCSALSGWLLTLPVTNCAGLVRCALELPWQFKLTALLQRSAAAVMSSQAASVVTHYGGTMAPPTVRTAWLEVKQLVERLTHLCKKVDQTLSHGRVIKALGLRTVGKVPSVPPVFTDEFFATFKPGSMYSKRLFNEPSLAHLLLANREAVTVDSQKILLLITFELLCRELDFHPAVDFLTD